jgi:hypothetical protein
VGVPTRDQNKIAVGVPWYKRFCILFIRYNQSNRENKWTKITLCNDIDTKKVYLKKLCARETKLCIEGCIKYLICSLWPEWTSPSSRQRSPHTEKIVMQSQISTY